MHRMFARSPAPGEWRHLLADGIGTAAELLEGLGLGVEILGPAGAAAAAARQFAVRVPRGFAARMRPGDPADPSWGVIFTLNSTYFYLELMKFYNKPLSSDSKIHSPSTMTSRKIHDPKGFLNKTIEKCHFFLMEM